MLKIFTDHCVHTDVVEALRISGFRVIRALEVGLANAPDEGIFEYAKKRGFTLLSFDKEFGNFSRFDSTHTSGIVLVYIENISKERIIKEILNFFNKATFQSLRGKLFIIEPGRIRQAQPKK